MANNDLLTDLLSVDAEDRIVSVLVEEDEVLSPFLDEISTILDPRLQSFVRAVLLGVHPDFWVMPAAEDLDMHPPDEYREGGLVLHTKRVFRTALLMAQSQMMPSEDVDALLAAALIHDIAKADPRIPNFLHSCGADKIVEEISLLEEASPSDVASNVSGLIGENPEMLVRVMRLVRSHEGLGSPNPELVPKDPVETLLHLANQVSVNLDRIIDGPNVQAYRWENSDDAEASEEEVS